MKYCPCCKQNLSVLLFGKDKQAKDGYRYICKDCNNRKSREYQKTKPIESKESKKRYNQKNGRKTYMKYEYGPNGLVHYETQYSKQKGCCAICQKHLKVLCQDHNHENQQLRGLLCSACNRALGLLKDNLTFIKAAVQYLNYWIIQDGGKLIDNTFLGEGI
jgi:hypothetical protein